MTTKKKYVAYVEVPVIALSSFEVVADSEAEAKKKAVEMLASGKYDLEWKVGKTKIANGTFDMDETPFVDSVQYLEEVEE